MKLKAIHWILLAIGGMVLFLFVLLMTILIYKFLANPRTKSEAPRIQNHITANIAVSNLKIFRFRYS